MHTALWCLTAVSLLGAVVSFARPKHVDERAGGESQPLAEDDGLARAHGIEGRAGAVAAR